MQKITRTTLCGLFVAVAAFAQLQQVTKLTAADAAAGARFGEVVSLSGDTAIVSASAGSDFGSAYVFERDQGGAGNWGQVARLTAAAPAAFDQFGNSVSLSGDTAVVGAYQEDAVGSDSGTAYVFERDQGGAGNWGPVTQLLASDTAPSDWFGYSVSLSGDTAVVGAVYDDDAGSNSGSAYVFERDQGGAGNWGQVAKLTADDAADSDAFGFFVSLSGDTAVVGATNAYAAAFRSGSAYVFERDQGGADAWGQVAKLTADDAADSDLFGHSVAVDGDTAVVGAWADDDAGSNSGSAYVFERDQGGAGAWGQVAKLTAADAAAQDYFGISVSVSGGTAAVGAHQHDDVDSNSGAVYVFERDQGGAGAWGQASKLTAADAAGGDWFGYSVSVSGDTAFVGAIQDGVSGSAYVFRSTGPLLTVPTAVPAPSDTSIDVPVELTTNGNALASLAFSLDYDATCLSFDAADGNADGIPDAVDVPLPATFSAVVFHDLGDTDGELDVTLFADDPTITTFTDGVLATVTFTTTCASSPTASVVAPVVFSSDPTPSFGAPDAQDVVGSTAAGSVEIFSGVRGDCNASGVLSAADITACQLESFDGDGTFWADTLDAVPYLGSPVGCDANADTVVDAGDLSCKARLIFGLACGGALRGVSVEGPRLSLPAKLSSAGGGVVAAITFERRGTAVNSLIFSLDYDETRLIFDDVPGAVRFLGAPVSLESLSFDAGDTDGELDVVVADLTTTGVISEGVLVEVDLRLREPGAATIEGGVAFSTEPPASFGDLEGRSVPGTAEVDMGFQRIFADGFESGDTSAWAGTTGG